MIPGVSRLAEAAEGGNSFSAELAPMTGAHSLIDATLKRDALADALPAAIDPGADAVPCTAANAILPSLAFVIPDGVDVRASPILPDTSTEWLIDADDDLNPGRGFVTAILLAVPIWGAVGLVIWFVM